MLSQKKPTEFRPTRTYPVISPYGQALLSFVAKLSVISTEIWVPFSSPLGFAGLESLMNTSSLVESE